MIDLLAQQVASPVQFVKGLRTLYNAGARVFVEVGPKKALQGFAEDVLGSDADVFSLFTNHPKLDDLTAFNQALCGLYAAGLGRGVAAISPEVQAKQAPVSAVAPQVDTLKQAAVTQSGAPTIHTSVIPPVTSRSPSISGHEPHRHPLMATNTLSWAVMFADVLDRGWEIYHGQKPAAKTEPVVITGAALGLPGTKHIFDDGNVERILRGDQFIV